MCSLPLFLQNHGEIISFFLSLYLRILALPYSYIDKEALFQMVQSEIFHNTTQIQRMEGTLLRFASMLMHFWSKPSKSISHKTLLYIRLSSFFCLQKALLRSWMLLLPPNDDYIQKMVVKNHADKSYNRITSPLLQKSWLMFSLQLFPALDLKEWGAPPCSPRASCLLCYAVVSCGGVFPGGFQGMSGGWTECRGLKQSQA